MDNLVCVEDFEKAALKFWDENAAGYYTRWWQYECQIERQTDQKADE